MSIPRHLALAAVLAAVLAACGGDAGGVETGADASAGTDAGAACDRSGLSPTAETAERDDELGVLFYTAIAGAADPFDRLTVDFYFSLGASDAPQTVELGGQDLADCHTCLLLYRGCSASSCLLATTFLAQAGTLTVSAIGAAGTDFVAALAAARFVEVEIDFATQHAEIVEGGETWCLPDQAMSASITAP